MEQDLKLGLVDIVVKRKFSCLLWNESHLNSHLNKSAEIQITLDNKIYLYMYFITISTAMHPF